MFDRKNKSSKKTADRASVKVLAASITDLQREQIEQELAGLDPTWKDGECHLSIPLDVTTQEQLGQLVGMFPNGDIRLQTTMGDNIIMSGADYDFDTSYISGSGNPGRHSDDTAPLPS